MDIMDSMKHALQVGTPKASPPATKKKPKVPAAFQDSMEYALHVGTPAPRKSAPAPMNGGPRFLD